MAKETAPTFGEQQQGPALVPFDAYAKKEEKFAAELTESALRASIDLPTGILNKETFENLVKDRVAEAQEADDEAEPTLALIKTDTDGFKQINDSLGHQAGDKYIADLAAALPLWFRPEDAIALIGRVGGDEIDILLDLKPREVYEAEHQQEAERTKEYSPPERLAAVVDRFNECKEAFFASQPEGIQALHQRRVVDLAIGAALWQPGWNKDELSHEADTLLYAVKQRQHAERDRLRDETLSDFQKEVRESAKRMLRDAGLEDEASKLG